MMSEKMNVVKISAVAALSFLLLALLPFFGYIEMPLNEIPQVEYLMRLLRHRRHIAPST